MNEEYSNAYSEVVGILDNIPTAMYKKIPTDMINVFRNKCNSNYKFEYNIYKSLDEQNISEYAKLIIAILFRDYWATEEQKQKILTKEEYDKLKIEQEKREKYNSDNIFKKRQESYENNEEVIQNVSMVKYEESFITKFLNMFKRLFGKR